MECMLRLPGYEPVGWVAPKCGDVFLDVGAYVGWYTIQAAKAVGALGRVIGLEPDEHNRRQLEENLELNGLSNSTVIPLAARFEAAEIGWRADDVPVWRKVDQGPRQIRSNGNNRLPGERFSLTNVHWIKMDIEGAEIEALQGAEKVLRQFRPILFIEIHETLDVVCRFLDNFGYVIEKSEFDQPPDRHGWILARHL